MQKQETLTKNQKIILDLIEKSDQPLKAYSILFDVKKKGITKKLVNSGFVLGPLLAIHWSTMFKSIELNSVAVGIGLVFSYPIFVIFLNKK